ncbi:Flagellar basal body-associated protein FliL [hydrothermal vent metagenome]|uniref:Flagellar basal body-associated protein FliL n=1 Tax=hydrothermal vent metagenome TaxID=652676 RepID=A0A3B1DE21_9ZZZZ
MAEEKEEKQEDEAGGEKRGEKSKLKLLIIAVVVLVLLGGGGFFAYSMFLGKKSESKAVPIKGDNITAEQPALFPLAPFVVNLADRGRFLKVTIKFEMTDIKYEELIKERTPHLRDAVITLLSSKTAESISTPEGKFQLKDELLMRANSAVGRDVFKNIYFTDFVMQ